MKKEIYFIIFGLLFGISCNSLKPLPDKTVNQMYRNVDFYPDWITHNLEERFSLTVEPVDASSLNELTANAAMRAGDYEREVVQSYYEIENDDEELVAVITAAVASHMDKSTSTIVVKNIVRVNDDTPTWGKVGRINQLKSNL